MRELRLEDKGRTYTYQVPEKYDEMDARQYRAAMLRLMRLSDCTKFWESFVGMPQRFCGSLPEWVHMELSSMIEYIPILDEKLDRFLIKQLPLLNHFRQSRLMAPKPKLVNMSFQQFMSADNFFSFYSVTQRETFIDLLCASLYLKDGEVFVVEDKRERLVPMEEREKYIHRFVPVEVRFGVFVNWIFIKNWLTDLFPHLFQKGKSDGKPKANDWLPLFDSFVGDNIPYIKNYQAMPCMDAFRILDRKIKQQNEKK